MKVFKDRLRDELTRSGLRPSELARRSNFSATVMNSYLDGTAKPENIRVGNLIRLAKALAVDPIWLLTGKGGEIKKALSWEDAYKAGESFTIQMPDDTMAPDIHEGDTLIVEPPQELSNGYILAVLLPGDTAPTARKFRLINGTELLEITNPSIPDQFRYTELTRLDDPKRIHILGHITSLNRPL